LRRGLEGDVVSAGISIAILLMIAAMHVYWAAGGRFGKSVSVPEHDGRKTMNPGAASTLGVAACLVVAAAIIAVRAGVLQADVLQTGGFGWLAWIGTWVLAVVFAARAIGDFRYVGFFKRVRGSRFARLDTYVYSPLCGLLAVLITVGGRLFA
jgi:Protein of unknown function (DUF3995)